MSEDSLPQWMQWLFAGWPMIRANLPLFAVIVVLIVGAFWFLFGWGYGRVIASKDSQIELQDRQLADYRDKLKGATPEQAKDKIDSLERTIKSIAGSRWQPLTSTQVFALSMKLKEIKKSRAHIMYENALGKTLAQDIFEAFKQAGWDEVQSRVNRRMCIRMVKLLRSA